MYMNMKKLKTIQQSIKCFLISAKNKIKSIFIKKNKIIIYIYIF